MGLRHRLPGQIGCLWIVRKRTRPGKSWFGPAWIVSRIRLTGGEVGVVLAPESVGGWAVARLGAVCHGGAAVGRVVVGEVAGVRRVSVSVLSLGGASCLRGGRGEAGEAAGSGGRGRRDLCAPA